MQIRRGLNSSIEFIKAFGFILFIMVMFLMLTLTVAFSQSVAGLKLIEIGQPQKGVEALRKAAEQDPSPANYFNLGTGLLQTGNLNDALAAFEKGGNDPMNLVGKGRVALRQNNLQAANANFDKAIQQTKSKNTQVLNAVAEAWLDKREFAAKAKAVLEKSEGIEQTFKASMLLGDVYLLEGNGGQAISNYEHAAMLDVRNAAPHYRIGNVYVRSTNKDAAIESFQKAVNVDPGYAPAYKELAELYYMMKNGPEAAKAQEKYMELSESGENGNVRMGYYQFMNRDFAKANDAFGKAYQGGTLKDNALRYYALSLVEAGDLAESQRIFEQYFSKAKPEQIDASDYAQYGKVLLKLEQDSLAVAAFENSLAIDSKQVPLRQLQAETLYKDKRYAESVAAYKQLIGLRAKPSSQDLYSLGRAYYYNENFQQSDSTFRKLIDLQPTMTVGYLWAGRSNAQLDPDTEKGLAKPFYEKLIEIGQATADKSRGDLKEAYSYLGYYYFVKNNAAMSRANWEKVLAIDPQDERAKEALKAIKQ
ncbi:MAG TPA: tetratricopeptide repeat protein [Cyclobacteriaceae bacterium]|nr:tetratricopeptide repeat protein [Cyclobacteriaceae bacterium]